MKTASAILAAVLSLPAHAGGVWLPDGPVISAGVGASMHGHAVVCDRGRTGTERVSGTYGIRQALYRNGAISVQGGYKHESCFVTSDQTWQDKLYLRVEYQFGR